MCVGNNFAMMELMLVLRRILERFELKTVHDFIDYHPLITLKPRNALLVFNKTAAV
jgi:cytochrome P450